MGRTNERGHNMRLTSIDILQVRLYVSVTPTSKLLCTCMSTSYHVDKPVQRSLTVCSQKATSWCLWSSTPDRRRQKLLWIIAGRCTSVIDLHTRVSKIRRVHRFEDILMSTGIFVSCSVSFALNTLVLVSFFCGFLFSHLVIIFSSSKGN